MRRRIYSDAEIEAIKARVENALEELEGANLAYQKWLTEWRLRQRKKAAP